MKAPEKYELEIGEGVNAGFVRVPGQNWREPTEEEAAKSNIQRRTSNVQRPKESRTGARGDAADVSQL